MQWKKRMNGFSFLNLHSWKNNLYCHLQAGTNVRKYKKYKIKMNASYIRHLKAMLRIVYIFYYRALNLCTLFALRRLPLQGNKKNDGKIREIYARSVSVH